MKPMTLRLLGTVLLLVLLSPPAVGQGVRARKVLLLDTSGSMEGKCGATCIPCDSDADCNLPHLPSVGFQCSGGRCVPRYQDYCSNIWDRVRSLAADRINNEQLIPDGNVVEVYVFDRSGKRAQRVWEGLLTPKSRNELFMLFKAEGCQRQGKGCLLANAGCTKLYDILNDLMQKIQRTAKRFDETDIYILTDGFDEKSSLSEEDACQLMKRAVDAERMNVRFWRTTNYSYVPDCFCHDNPQKYCPCYSDGDSWPDMVDTCPFLTGENNNDADGDTPPHTCFEKLECPGGPGTCGGDICDLDDDNDGDPDETDCAPLDASRGHNLEEICNGKDDDCDGETDEPWRQPGQDDPCAYCPAGDCDGDKVPNETDNCWRVPNPGQEDLDGDCPSTPYKDDPRCGDACDEDIDGDGVSNGGDNCWRTPNASQEDLDGDCPEGNFEENPACGDACDCFYRMKMTVHRPADPLSLRHRETFGVVEVEDQEGGSAAHCGAVPPMLRMYSASPDAALGLSKTYRWEAGAGHAKTEVEWLANSYPAKRPDFIEGAVHVMLASGTDPIRLEIEGELLTGETNQERSVVLWGDKTVAVSVQVPVVPVTLSWEPYTELECGPEKDSCVVNIGKFASTALSWGTDAKGAEIELEAEFVHENTDGVGPGDIENATVNIVRQRLAQGNLAVSISWVCGANLDPDVIPWWAGITVTDRSGWLDLTGEVENLEVYSDCKTNQTSGGKGWLVILFFFILAGAAWALVQWRRYPSVRGLSVLVTKDGEQLAPKRLWKDQGLRFTQPAATLDLAAIWAGLSGTLGVKLERSGDLNGAHAGPDGGGSTAKMGTVDRQGVFSPLQTIQPEEGVVIAIQQRLAPGVKRARPQASPRRQKKR